MSLYLFELIQRGDADALEIGDLEKDLGNCDLRFLRFVATEGLGPESALYVILKPGFSSSFGSGAGLRLRGVVGFSMYIYGIVPLNACPSALACVTVLACLHGRSWVTGGSGEASGFRWGTIGSSMNTCLCELK